MDHSVFLIALTGKKGTGKSTQAYHLAEQCRAWLTQQGLSFFVESLSLATPLKQMISVIAPHILTAKTNEEKNDPNLGICGRSLRFLLQTLGTEWGRNTIHADLWIRLLYQRIKQIEKRPVIVIVDDMRFRNELESFLKTYPSIFFGLHRKLKKNFLKEEAFEDKHCSEIQSWTQDDPIYWYDTDKFNEKVTCLKIFKALKENPKFINWIQKNSVKKEEERS